jgi:serine/threonine protein kinase/tetratricopeptide (TPR) repeat protein
MTDCQVLLGETLSSRYSIEREIGSGQLAVVYLAQDRKHRRPVAMKVLRPEVATGLASARFHREISILSSLHHPHILPLFDSDEADGLIYFTTPFVEGDTLASYLKKKTVLPLADAVRIARQVASALSYAHARGIIHRDIKPANILGADDVPQLADFGIARAVLEASSDRVTTAGLAVGSPAYMSPEQAVGSGTLDERSDLYSLACVLYEMLVGEPPFTGPTAQAVLQRHAVSPVPSIRISRPTVPSRLEQIVHTALSKFPADRHANVAEFAAELAEVEIELRAQGGSVAASRGLQRTSSAKKPSRDRPGVLVLPFLHLAPSTEADYIGAGLTDEIITSLSGLEGLRVISHTSALQLKGTSKGARELGKELNVSYVLEGSVRRTGETLRVAARLVAAESEDLVWGHSYQGDAADLLELEKTISRAVVDALAVRLSSNETRRLTEHRISDTRAFEYYLRARQEVYTFTAQGLDRALTYLKRAAERSSDNIALWAAMGYVYWQYVNAGISADPGYFQKARECADRILQIDPDSPEARRLLGLIEIHAKGDPQVAVDHLKAALEANPNDPDALFWLSLIYGCVGRPSSGYALAIRLLDIDPLTPIHHVVPGFLDVLDGDPQRALPWLLRAHELDPQSPITSIAYGQALAMAGETEEACRVLEDISTHVPESFFAGLGRAFSCAVQHRHDDAVAAITQDVVDNARHDLQYSWTLAQIYAMLGRPDEAHTWTCSAVTQGFWNYPLLAERDPLLAPLRGDPRFVALMQSTKEKWLNFRA